MSNPIKYTKSYQEYMATIPKVDAVELSAIVDDSMIRLSMVYANNYERDARTFIICFLKYPSVRTACAFIVQSYKHKGLFTECQQSDKDFTDYAQKADVDQKWKRVLADILLIIYTIIH